MYNFTFISAYCVISLVVAAIDVYMAVNAFGHKGPFGKYLGLVCIFAALVDITYLFSVINTDYFVSSLMSSLYFLCIDGMLICLIVFSCHFTGYIHNKSIRRILIGINLFLIFEIVVFMLNPFYEIAIGYVSRGTMFARYGYVMKPLYIVHLVYTYAMTIMVVVLLIYKLIHVPKEYRMQYYGCLGSIGLIVVCNAVFLYVKQQSIFSNLDVSILCYSVGLFFLYWNCFSYSVHGLINILRNSVIENIAQGIVLFDYNDKLLMHNAKAESLLPNVNLKEELELNDFADRCQLPLNLKEIGSHSMQLYMEHENVTQTLRCDYRVLENQKNQVVGRLLVFTDASLASDILTGFHSWEHFQRFAVDHPDNYPEGTAVAILDINSLSLINSTYGRSYGDQVIQQFAELMRKKFPSRTYFVRGSDVNLIALCNNFSDREMRECLAEIEAEFQYRFQYSISSVGQQNKGVLDAISDAARGMRAKKLLDKTSSHSQMLTSLIRALEECDSDTEAHVKRTQQMGDLLGQRIGLSDVQRSQLSLLCILHDIGKIGIPLEILNKPGKLSEPEWDIIKSHVEKGYQIANSSEELAGIAEMVRHHHERWDGKGYPDGLSRESIPLLSRIIAVVDAYDAMVNNRSYRKAISDEDARAELKRCAGTQFDPYIVSQFLHMLQEHNITVDNVTAEDQSGEEMKFTSMRDQHEQPLASAVHQILYTRYILDCDNKIIMVDDRFEALTGYTREEAMEMYQSDLIPPEDRMEYLCLVNEEIAKVPNLYLEHRLQRKDGRTIYVFCYGKMFYDSAVRSNVTEVIVTDVTDTYSMRVIANHERARAQTQLEKWESTFRRDSLTELMNHSAFQNDVEAALLRGDSRVMMLMMDVDQFKEYNDTYGHHAGDEYLILIAHALSGALRRDDLACRMGGDEFAAALCFDPDCDTALMYERAQQVFDKISMTLSSTQGSSSLSMGAVVSSEELSSFDQLYEAADRAMYYSKQHGRDRISFYAELPEEEKTKKTKKP